jgi:N-acyl-L-homoserine lactone synthetase
MVNLIEQSRYIAARTSETLAAGQFTRVSGPVLVGHIEGKTSLVDDHIWTIQDYLEGASRVWVFAAVMR